MRLEFVIGASASLGLLIAFLGYRWGYSRGELDTIMHFMMGAYGIEEEED